ncbi:MULTISPECIES: glutamate racemase [unclassified Enterococcus]|uniref:glutamate racemase n=1 Tax=unclassified Enterococcus TaxID=2608891 RepID=UPI0015566529|nr:MULTISPECIES: glutamate racemase [unclassified Enterococcus]MBS7576774.1 glutamate racemase [Enterococcus sp. MMGLQ5-2]MBS7583739.1 glutamate racemase [Enterococcus sp. MMGLQ5-1]NPD11600.1 glutamate racemase [Enterococcus sp. MMGLQ5-1]NPD36611.1 glutamate racemase [Enterococcus sp. MMGLQ5-2]
MDNRPIGFLDSGVGGLTVVREVFKQLPNETVLFIGDSARAPYGPRPKSQIVQFTTELVNFLLKQNIKMLVIACNTATAATLDILKARLTIPVIGVILPGSRAAIKATQNRHISVIGTAVTIESHRYTQAIQAKDSGIVVSELACPRFAPLVESGGYQSPVAKKVVAESLSPLRRTKQDVLILGCTHYPLLRPIIQNVMGDHITLIDSGIETVAELSVLLDYFDMAAEQSMPKSHRFYTTASVKLFGEIAMDWLNQKSLLIQHIELSDLQINEER